VQPVPWVLVVLMRGPGLEGSFGRHKQVYYLGTGLDGRPEDDGLCTEAQKLAAGAAEVLVGLKLAAHQDLSLR
jgi:hypothetical protein